MAAARMLCVFPLFFVCLSVCVLQCISTPQFKRNRPAISPEDVCMERGYLHGVCKSKHDDLSMCEDLICAGLSLSGNDYVGIPTGPAFEGTLCGKSKVCKSSRCEVHPEAGVPYDRSYKRGKHCSHRVLPGENSLRF